MAEKKPLLSIGIIFRDDIRCIERCLKALQPLRDSVPSELIMADTGSVDGSREIAEKYADILIDFPWIDDFAAARNSTVDLASGTWFLTVDTDEYLDPDFSQLVEFLKMPESRKTRVDACMLLIRSYDTYEMDRAYSDFMGMRLIRMSTGARYEGAVHECWMVHNGKKLGSYSMPKVILHHDGYVNISAKLVRNMPMIRRRLEKTPEDLRTWMQAVESGADEPDFKELISSSVTMVERKVEGWDQLGPAILRNAVYYAFAGKFPEVWAWIEKAETLFPDSPLISMDVQYYGSMECWELDDYEGCIRRGERYLETLDWYRRGEIDPFILRFSPLRTTSPFWEQMMRIFMSKSYLETDRVQEAWYMAEKINFSVLDEHLAQMSVSLLHKLHSFTDYDTAPLIVSLWENYINKSTDKFEARRDALTREVAPLFTCHTWHEEKQNGQRHGALAYLPLEGKFWAGDAAALLSCKTAEEAVELLPRIEELSQLPPLALLHPLDLGAEFPPMAIEEMDNLAARMAAEGKWFVPLAVKEADRNISGDRGICWLRAIVLAAVRTCPWKDAEQGIALARAFAKMEKSFLPTYYSRALLNDQGIQLLPPMHRFGWYCVRAYEALDGGDSAGFIRLLGKGLETAPEMKPMVEFLSAEMERQLMGATEMTATPELISLAEQVRTILAAYGPDDPAVAAIKESPAYKQVAWLIDKPATEPRGLAQ